MASKPDILSVSRNAVEDRLKFIEAAALDLSPQYFGIFKAQVLDSDPYIPLRYQNRVMTTLLLLYHLRDDVRRLSRAAGIERKHIEDFVSNSEAITLCIRAGDTWKHGLGGRENNATIGNGLIKVYKTTPGCAPRPESDAIVEGLPIVDADHGVRSSTSVVNAAIQEWGQFLNATFGIQLPQALQERVVRSSTSPILLKQDAVTVVPPGSVVAAPFPPSFVSTVVEDVHERVARTKKG